MHPLCLVFGITDLLRKCVEENATSTLDQQEYQERYTALVRRYETAKAGLTKLNDKRLERNAKCESLEAFLRTLEKSYVLLAEFDEELWSSCVENVKVHSEQRIAFVFKDGMDLDWSM